LLEENFNTKKQNNSLRLKEIKQLMNPHFVFNALNSIQSRILMDRKDDAIRFLNSFSRLIRRNMEISEKDWISIDEELELIQVYLELEKSRMNQKFDFQFKIQSDAMLSKVMIPTFLIQPLVENAIWHGLMPKESDRVLLVEVQVEKSELEIWIKDNGVGFGKNQNRTHNSESKGIQMIKERLLLVEKMFNRKIELSFVEPNEGTGTHVRLYSKI
jgi:LytS/YehU family sensor histidine kinase